MSQDRCVSIQLKFLRWSLVSLLLCGLTEASAGLDERALPAKRPITVVDAIQMTQWSNRDYFLGATPDSVGLFSPDKRKFVIVTKRGNIERNTVEYSLLLFQTDEALHSPKPERLITMSSSSNREGIASPKWLDDNRTVVFLGENPNEPSQLYSLDTQTRELRRWTSHPTAVVAYDITPDGRLVVYEAIVEQAVNLEEIRRNGVIVTAQGPEDLFPKGCTSPQKIETLGRAVFLQTRDQPAVKISSSEFPSESTPPVLSPDGRYAVLVANVGSIPASWTKYEDESLQSRIAEQRKPGTRSRVTQYMLLNTKRRELTPLLDAPLFWTDHGVAWAKDGNSVVVSGTYLPLAAENLDVENAEVLEAHRQHAYVAEIRLPNRKIVEISSRHANILGWNEESGKLLLGERDKRAPIAAFRRSGAVWKELPVTGETARLSDPLELTVEEGFNTPPRIVARAPKEHRKILLLDLNPQFAALEFGKVEAVTWNATDGHVVGGGLYLPPDYTLGKRYPLVIQTHGFHKDRFWIDGPWGSAFAAQPLAAKDIVVLQVGSSLDPGEDTKAAQTLSEAPRQMAAYEGAIDYLDQRGLIDRERVGIVGFSRTVFHVEYALTHSDYRFAAASLADGIDGGYMNYLLWPVSDYVRLNGGLPAGPSLGLWLKNSPGFNLDKVVEPVRLEYYGPAGFLGGWQWFSGLSLLNKPVELLWLPDGYHLLIKPWERLISQQGTVDWFDFWLQNAEDPDPAKREQYVRWEELRRKSNQNPQSSKAPSAQ
jgi:dipeptidyl aminopeptidase/acylaminoacyl peptidase